MRFRTLTRSLIRSLCPVLLAGTGLAAAELQPGEMDLVIALDGDAFRAGAVQAAPTSLFADPNTADVRAHIRRQFELLKAEEREFPPLADIIVHSKRQLMTYAQPTGDVLQGHRRQIDFAWVMETGAMGAAMGAWLQGVVGDEETTERVGMTGYTENGDTIFLAQDDKRFVVGEPAVLAATLKHFDELSVGDAPVHLRLDLSGIMGSLAKLAEFEDEIDPVMSSFLPNWKEAKPVWTQQLHANAQGWGGSGSLTGVGALPLAPVPAALLKSALPDQEVSLAIGVDPNALFARVLGFVSMEMRMDGKQARAVVSQELEALSGVSLDKALDMLDGSILLQGGWSTSFGPIPNSYVALGVKDRASVEQVLDALLPMARAEVDELAGAQRAWSITTPVATLLVGLTDDALVVGNQRRLVEQFLAGGQGHPGLPAGSALALHANAQSLALKWLPLLWQTLAGVEEKLGSDLSDRVSTIRWPARQAIEHDPRPASLAAFIRDIAEDGERRWMERGASALFPAGDAVNKLDTHLSIWIEKANDGGPAPRIEPHIVIRTDKGWLISQDWREMDGPFATAEEAQASLKGYDRVFGPELAALPPVPEPEVAVFDIRWFPTLDVMLEHLPQEYSLVFKATDDGLEMTEKGLPLASVGLGMLAATSIAGGHEINRELRRLRRELQRERMRSFQQDKPEVMASLQSIGQALRQARREDAIPDSAAGLVLGGYLNLNDTAGLFAGSVPKSAKALDLAGRWDSETQSWPRFVYAVRIDDKWTAVVTAWGDVQAVANVPVPDAIPANAATIEPDAEEVKALEALKNKGDAEVEAGGF